MAAQSVGGSSHGRNVWTSAQQRIIPIKIVPYGIQLAGFACHGGKAGRNRRRDAGRVCDGRVRLERDSERRVNNEKMKGRRVCNGSIHERGQRQGEKLWPPCRLQGSLSRPGQHIQVTPHSSSCPSNRPCRCHLQQCYHNRADLRICISLCHIESHSTSHMHLHTSKRQASRPWLLLSHP